MIEQGILKVGHVVRVTAAQDSLYSNGDLLTVSRVATPNIFGFTTSSGVEVLVYNEEVSWPSLPAAPFDNDLEAVVHPAHYGGDTTYEAIKVIEAWGLGFNTGNATKYISRAGKKDKSKELEDINKAIWYLQREAAKLEEASA